MRADHIRHWITIVDRLKVIKTWNNLSLDITKVKCDAYDFEKGDVLAINSFHGEYMVNYSWAEFKTGVYVAMEQNRR